MRLAFAYFADGAQYEEKLHVLGGGSTCVYGRPFPLTVHSIALVVHLVVDPKEFDSAHTFGLVIEAPDRQRIPPEISGSLVPRATLFHPDRPAAYTLAVTLQGLELPLPGEYVMRMSVDGQEIGTVSLDATDAPAPTAGQ